MKKRRLLALLLALSLLPASVYGCGKKQEEAPEEPQEEEEAEETETVLQEFDFYSDDESIIYFNFPEEYTLSGKTYQLMEDIEYETLGTRDVVQAAVDMAVEELTDIPDTYEYESESGKVYELNNEQVYIKSQGRVMVPVIEEIHYDEQWGKPSPEQTKMITYYDRKAEEDREVEGTLTSFEETTPGRWESVLKVDGEFMAPAGSVDTYALAGADNVVVSRSAETPVWDGYEKAVLTSLGLPGKYFRITSAAWNGEQYEQDGNIYRNACFYGDAFVSDYTATYEGAREVENGYDTKVYYRADAESVEAEEEDVSTVYHIKAVVRYSLVEN